MDWSIFFTVIGGAHLALVALGIIAEAGSPSKTKAEKRDLVSAVARLFIIGTLCLAIGAAL